MNAANVLLKITKILHNSLASMNGIALSAASVFFVTFFDCSVHLSVVSKRLTSSSK